MQRIRSVMTLIVPLLLLATTSVGSAALAADAAGKPVADAAHDTAAATTDDVDDFIPPDYLEPGWYARIETDRGRILAMLLPDQAPQSVAHFAALAEGRLPWTDPVTGEEQTGHYYDGVLIHKAEGGRQIEAGDRHGTGSGAPLMYVPEEGKGPINFNGAGRLGMTRTSGRRISAVQFFVTYAAQPWLSGRHPCFGIVIDGRDVVFALSDVKTYGNGRPIEPEVIRKIRIFKVGDPDPLPDPEPYWPTPSTFRAIPSDPGAH